MTAMRPPPIRPPSSRLPLAGALDPGRRGQDARHNASLLKELIDAAASLARRLGQENQRPAEDADKMSIGEIAVAFERLCTVIRRAILLTLGLPRGHPPQKLGAESRDRVIDAIEAAIERSAAFAMDRETYCSLVLDQLEREIDDDLDDLDELDELYEDELDSRPIADVIAELCCALGLILRTLPPHWAQSVPAALRILCDRAVAAAIRTADATPPGNARPERDPVEIVQAVIRSMAKLRKDRK